MRIQILQLLDGARAATGLTVVIDVFRAFSVACYAMAGGAEAIIPVGDIDLAYRLKAEHPDYILMGEREGRIQPGFDYGNSPAHIETVDFTGKTLVQTTSAGTQGIAGAARADEILTGSLVNARAVAGYIRAANPAAVSLVCMGNAGKSPADEDTVCAEYIRSLLEHRPYDMAAAVAVLKNGAGRRFFDPANAAWSPERDFHLCVEWDRFDFALRVEKAPDVLYYLKKAPNF